MNAQLNVFLCPSAQGPRIQRGLAKTTALNNAPTLTAAVGDYSAVYSWGFPYAVPNDPPLRDPWAVGALSPTPEDATGIFGGAVQFQTPRLKNVTDGMSNTVIVIEQSAKTERWARRQRIQVNPTSARAWAPWSGQACTWILSYLEDGEDWSPTGLGPCNINCNNSQGVYSFHLGGANALFLDGSVRFFKEGMRAQVLYAFVSRSRGETIGGDEW